MKRIGSLSSQTSKYKKVSPKRVYNEKQIET